MTLHAKALGVRLHGHFLALTLLLAGCTGNTPFRSEGMTPCDGAGSCDRAIVEQHDRDDYKFDLAFVEFTERGNVFDRNHFDAVLDHVAEEARYHKDKPDKGVLAIVFVHGWKNNASHDNYNVQSFKKLLAKTARLTKDDDRRVVGIYVGWRGLSLNAGLLTELSYWDRKAVAHQVGKGGVTELLLALERAVVDDDRPNRNLFLTTGHSFGGAIVLTALNEILLERVLEAKASRKGDDCLESRPFGQGAALLNPAVEANEMLQLKEFVANNCFEPSQDRLMHVISSDADTATNIYFPLGQWFGVNLGWRQTEFTRSYEDHEGHIVPVTFKESELDTITVGNYVPFRTGRLIQDPTKPSGWDYGSCVEDTECIDDEEKELPHIPVKSHEPLAFIWTDENYIGGHNDVFTDSVAAYLATIVAEARNKRVLADPTTGRGPGLPIECAPLSAYAFDFGVCLEAYQKLYARIPEEKVGQ